jgi:hypothetical protein
MFKHWSMVLTLAVVALPASLAAAADSGPTAAVKVTVVFPASLDSFDNLSVKAILSQSQPPAPDQSPRVTNYRPVDTQVVEKVSHVNGTDSTVAVVVGKNVKLDGSLKYLAMATVWDGRKYRGGAAFKNKPAVPVLTGGAPNTVTLTVDYLNKVR